MAGAGRAGVNGREVAFAAAVLLLGVLLGVGTARLPVPPTYSQVGPHLFPALIAGGLCLIGLGLLRDALAGARRRDAPAAERVELDLRALALVTVGLVVQMVLLPHLGFVIAASILFVAVAAAFGSRRPLVDAAIALVLTALVQVAFTRGLGLRLPAGPFDALL